jgi:hypothetical protein
MTWRPRWTNPVWLALALALLAFTWGVATMSRYGVTFDSPSLFYAGDRTLFALLHPDVTRALDLLDDKYEPVGFTSEFAPSPERIDIVHYPAFPGIVCALTNTLFHVRFHWLDTIDGHQVGLVLLHALALFGYAWYGTRLFGRRAAVIATLLLATFPCALGHSFNNPKDWPSAQFYGLTMLAAGLGVVERRPRHVTAAGVLLGVALSCKLNGIFALAALAAWIPIAWAMLYWRRRKVTPGLVGSVLAAPYLAFVFFFWAWPWLHHGDVREWLDNLVRYLQFMVKFGVVDRHAPSSYPLRILLFTTPPVVLAGALVTGLTGFWRSRERAAKWALLVLWAGLPVARSCTPTAFFYDQNRHYIEYVPGLCMMAGVGLSALGSGCARLADRWKLGGGLRVGAAGVACAALAACMVWPIAQYHPYETTYFNALAGGLGRAQRRGLLYEPKPLEGASEDECDFWYQSLREALRRLVPLMKPGDTVSALGPWSTQLFENWPGPGPLPFAPTRDEATWLVAYPRHWHSFHELEGERPVVWRELRAGGVVFELLGPVDGKRHEWVSPRTRYDGAG